MQSPNGQIRTRDAFLYTCKAAVAAVVAYLLCRALSVPGEVWAAVSALIVIQPTLHPSLRASIIRVAANCIAAVVGGTLNALVGMPLMDLFVGIMAVGMICHHTKLDDGLRAGYAGLAIVTLTMDATAPWASSWQRVVAVLLGCCCTLMVNVVFEKLFFVKAPAHGSSTAAPDDRSE